MLDIGHVPNFELDHNFILTDSLAHLHSLSVFSCTQNLLDLFSLMPYDQQNLQFLSTETRSSLTLVLQLP